tara:strand:+ start:4603 stop:4755 length:153 start_codon:yes stop_codon:yes gene_type:complete
MVDKPGWNASDGIFALILIIVMTIAGGIIGFLLSAIFTAFMFIKNEENKK